MWRSISSNWRTEVRNSENERGTICLLKKIPRYWFGCTSRETIRITNLELNTLESN